MSFACYKNKKLCGETVKIFMLHEAIIFYFHSLAIILSCLSWEFIFNIDSHLSVSVSSIVIKCIWIPIELATGVHSN